MALTWTIFADTPNEMNELKNHIAGAIKSTEKIRTSRKAILEEVNDW